MQLEIVSSQDPHVEGSVAGPGGAPIHQEPIRVADPGARCAAMAPALSSAFARVLASGRYIIGPEVAACEAELEDYVGVPAVGAGCGTDGLILALRAVGVQPGDEVVTAAHTATATVAAIHAVGAEPVLAEIAADSCCVDPASVARLIGPRTRAIVAVHMFGEPADAVTLAALAAAHGIALIEDCAQAH